MKTTRNMRFALAAVAAAVSLVATTEAGAKGCNGVVNPAVWGCAPWDNNNGPKFPNYKKPAAHPAVAPKPVVAPPKPVARPDAGSGIVSGGAGNIVSGGAGNIVSGGAGNMRSK